MWRVSVFNLGVVQRLSENRTGVWSMSGVFEKGFKEVQTKLQLSLSFLEVGHLKKVIVYLEGTLEGVWRVSEGCLDVNGGCHDDVSTQS